MTPKIYTGPLLPNLPHEDLVRRALGHLDADGKLVGFGFWTLLILGAALSAVISHYIEKCLNHIDPQALRSPNRFERWRLRRNVKWGFGEAIKNPDVRKAHSDAGRPLPTVGETDACYGDDLNTALLAFGESLTADDLKALQS